MTNRKPLRVLHVIDNNGLGGAQTLLNGFAHYPASDTEHHVLALRRQAKPLFEASEKIEVVESESKFSLAPLLRIRTAVREKSIDIVHCHLARSHVFVALLKLLKAIDVPVVAHEHGQILSSNDQKRSSNFAYQTLLRTTRFAFSQYIAVSNATQRALVAQIGVKSDDITVVPSFVDTDEFSDLQRQQRRQNARTALALADDDFVVGIAGRIAANKGWHIFMEGFRKMAPVEKPPVAIVTGNGPDREEFEQQVAQLPENLRLIDLKWVDDIRDFYTALDCFVAPSFAEGSPVAAREAMALGLAVISSDAEGFLDLIDDRKTGLVFPIGDAAALANLMTEVCADEGLRKNLANAASLQSKQFSTEQYLSNLDAVYGKSYSS